MPGAALLLGVVVVANPCLGQAQMEQPPTQGEDVLVETQQEETSSVRALIKEGNARFEAGQPELALSRFEAAARVDPESVEAAFNRGCALYRLGRLDEAVAAFRSVESVPTCPPEVAEAARYNTARALMEQAASQEAGGQLPEALEGYQHASELFGDVARQNAGDVDAARNYELSRLAAARVQELMQLQQQMAQQQQEMADQLEELSQQQQQAADQTSETAQQEQQQEPEDSQQESQDAQQRKQEQLQQQQQDLNEKTESLSDQLEQMQQEQQQQQQQSQAQQQAQQKMDEARQAQQEASEQLEQGNLDQAEQSQREASEKLSEAAESLKPPEQSQQDGQQQQQPSNQQDENQEPSDQAQDQQQQPQDAQSQDGQQGEAAQDGEPIEPSAELVQALIDREQKNREAREQARQQQLVKGQTGQPDKDW
ncbi:MAG: hypothetical protein D8M59_04840 [Planctomycetes bacterium]|nr:hypothetical protein [Planctomycetota bacterium]